MHRIQTIVILLLLNSVENFSLIKNKIGSRLQNPSSELKSNTSTTRASRTCVANAFTNLDCELVLNFNESLVLPANCSQIETDYACEVIITIDYVYQQIGFIPLSASDDLTIDNITYDSVMDHILYLDYGDNSTYHLIYYGCTTGSYCEWEYAQQMISKLIHSDYDYQSLYNSLLPKVYNSNDQPNIIECLNDTELVNCSSGTCNFFQSTDDNYNILISRGCGIFQEVTVDIGYVRYTPGPTKYDYDIISFICNNDQCNSPTNEYEIKELISKWNEYINNDSLGTKLQLTNLNLYFLSLVLIQYLK